MPKNPAAAASTWRTWMLQGTAPQPGSQPDCATPIQRNVAFGKAHRIEGTPAIIFEDGTKSNGYMSAAEIEAKLVSLK